MSVRSAIEALWSPRNVRVLASVLLGGGVGWFIGTAYTRDPSLYAADFTGVWRAAGALLAGIDPYRSIPEGAPYPLGPLAYPLQAAVAALPLAPLTAAAAAGVFVGFGTFALAFAIMNGPAYRLLIFASPTFLVSIALVQWSPLLTAAGMVAPFGVFAACKPNLGLALFARRPSWWIVGGGAVLTALAFVLVPTWLGDWLGGVREMSYYKAPIAVTGGAILALAALRWRDPDARLLLALSVVPSNLILYDQLPLFLVARSRRDYLILVAGGWLSRELTRFVIPEWLDDVIVRQTYMRAPVVACLFLPALYMVLSRPNPDGQPDFVDRVLNRPITLGRRRREEMEGSHAATPASE
jgi:hypothetical protein